MTTEVVVVTTTNTVVTENTATNVVEVTASGTTPTVEIIAEGPAGPPGGQVTVQDEGVDVGVLEDKLNFVGSMVGVTNNPATETVTVTITAPSPTVTLTGAVTGSGTMTNLGNVSIATTATADPTLTLSGDATGSATFTNLGDATLSVTVVDDSHNHIISNVDGLQDALDAKAPLASPTFTGTVTLPSTTSVGTVSATEIGYLDGVTSGIQSQLDSKLASSSYTAADVLTKIKTVDGAGSGLDADLLDGESGAYYLDFTNATNKPDPTITLSGDATGSVTLTDLASGTLSVTVVDDSHNHVISNVDGLQDALDAKLPSASYTAADVLDKIKTVDGAGSGLDADLLDGQSSAYYTAINDRLGYTAENAANKGVANGYASLDGAGLVPSTQLPSYVDDVVEYANVAAFPATGTSGIIYVAIDTSKTYRWAGSTYVEISASPGSTDAVPEGSVNLYFTTARARQSVSAGTGISYNNSTGVITNSAPDQTVSLTGSGTTSISGTYPNFTISSADQYVGTVTSVALSGGSTGLTVTGSPITSSGTLTIGGTLALASGGTGATTAADARTNLGLGTAATTDASAYATAAQGAKADTAVQTIASADGSVTITGTTAIDLAVVKATNASNLLVPVRNATGATLTKGTAVYISGATGQISTVTKAIASGDPTSAQTLGLIAADLPNNTNGNVVLIGSLTGIDTSAYSDGQQLYLSPSVAGTLTATKPYAPNHLVYIAVVEYAHAINGKLFVKVQNGYELDELHDVAAQSPTNGQTIVYNSTSGLWEKNTVSLTAGVNGTLPVANGGTGATTLTNNGVLIGKGTSAITATAAGLTGQVLVGNTGYAPSWATLSSSAVTSFSGGTTGLTPSTATTGAITLAGTLGVANGGTGATTFTTNALLKGAGTSALSSSVMYENGGYVGINVTGPVKLLDGQETYNGEGGFSYVNLSTGASSAASITAEAGGSYFYHKVTRATGVVQFRGVTATTLNQDFNTQVFRSTGGTEYMRIDSSGNVGIGTSSPTQRLHVRQDQNGTTAALIQNRNATGSSVAAVQFISGAFDLSDNRYAMIASDGGSNTTLQFWTGQGATPTERMRIDSSGNVGIGTSSPGEKLTVYSATDTYATVRSASQVLAFNAGTGFTGSGATSIYNTSAIPMVFGTNNAERMRIDSSGNVGIGTNGPSFKLDVQGNSSSTATVVRSRNNDTSASSLAAFNCSTGEGVNAEWYSYSSANWFGTKSNHPQIFITNNTERARITSGGDFLVGTTSTGPGYTNSTTGFDVSSDGTVYCSKTGNITQVVNNNTSGNTLIWFGYQGANKGSIALNGTTGVLYNVTSDARAKHDIVDAPEASSVIDAIQVRSFKWNADSSEQRYGFIAQELVQVAPEAVYQPSDESEMMGVDYSKLVPMLVKELQSLRARVAELEGK